MKLAWRSFVMWAAAVSLAGSISSDVSAQGEARKNLCRVHLRNLPIADDVYYKILHIESKNYHVTCSFDWRSAKEIDIIFNGNETECSSKKIADRDVLKIDRNIDDEDYAGCRAGTNSRPQNQRGNAKKTAYFWVSKNNSVPYMRQQAINYAALRKGIAFSGVPIVNDLMSNVGICFEEMSETNIPPSVLLRKIGLPKPDWADEKVLAGRSCEEGVDELARATR